jgi:hypothetical protein
MLQLTLMWIILKYMDDLFVLKQSHNGPLNDNFEFIMQIGWKMWIQKICPNNVKIRIEKKSP